MPSVNSQGIQICSTDVLEMVLISDNNELCVCQATACHACGFVTSLFVFSAKELLFSEVILSNNYDLALCSILMIC